MERAGVFFKGGSISSFFCGFHFVSEFPPLE